MRILSVLIVLAQLASGQGSSATGKPVLQLETRLVSQDYCRRPPSDAINLALHLHLKFTNNGSEPLILYRKCDGPVSISFSATAADALSGRYEQEGIASYSLIFPRLISGKEWFPPQDYFVVLNPGESYYLNHATGFNYCIPARKGCPSVEGTHYLRELYATWAELPKLAGEMRARWRPFGLLWAGDVVTEPVQFTVTEQPSIPLCAPLEKEHHLW